MLPDLFRLRESDFNYSNYASRVPFSPVDNFMD